MANTTPSLETIRRLCLLNRVAFCYLLIDTSNKYVYVLVDLEDNKIEAFCQELESWCGMKFKVFNDKSDHKEYRLIKRKGEKVYPM